jgi:hypothetical protein
MAFGRYSNSDDDDAKRTGTHIAQYNDQTKNTATYLATLGKYSLSSSK